ncbi:hypothetical protein ISF_02583 [Cordyceps fumosorosea ARSEF 2679]|uniref:Uncharacterized protein n=1 Tax=Cordyceps fumosorosea (strain ARSEF 2679) TaxID=1081104 RepID=A0A162MUE0_CORFA|nr:hypothetical protein ISF_02583 [Cordyceps fumosorosea ARSEF 2679]OAA70609.1 hypothetical protein ISF_02583 [Cordyceps fumosorosea ARSEF 2679]
MGNPDLELQNPDWDPHCRRRRGPTPRRFIARLCITALAAGMLLTMAVCGLLGGTATTTPSLLHQLLRPQPCPAHRQAQPHEAVAATTTPPSHDASSSSRGAVAGVRADVYLQRRNALAEVLKAEGVEAFVAEPGPIFEYYANISRTDWEAFAPSQRPLLMVIQPVEHPSSSGGSGAVVVAAKMALLAPRAQADRVRLEPVPHAAQVAAVCARRRSSRRRRPAADDHGGARDTCRGG